MKDSHTLVTGSVGLLVGFLIAALVFAGPWKFPPNWGDIPTWLAVVVASAGGAIALSQLRGQQDQFRQQSIQDAQRDKVMSAQYELMQAQLAEVRERTEDRRREQARQVTLTVFPVGSPPEGTGQATVGRCLISNGSDRPIRQVACRMIWNHEMLQPGHFLTQDPLVAPGQNGENWTQSPGKHEFSKGGPVHDVLARREVQAVFQVTSASGKEARFAIQFTDDDGQRWKLDDREQLSSVPLYGHNWSDWSQ